MKPASAPRYRIAYVLNELAAGSASATSPSARIIKYIAAPASR